MSPMTDSTSLISRLIATAALTALAANCFLKYLWWTACYSAWSGIPKFAAQWRAAGSNASFNGWSFIVLEAASISVLYTLIRLRSAEISPVVKSAVRFAVSLAIAIAATAGLALALSWLKQGIQ